MAKVTRCTKEVDVVKTITVKERVDDGVNLHLTDEEAKVLHKIFGCYILGSSQGPRGVTDRIWNQLGQFVDSKETIVKSKQSLYLE